MENKEEATEREFADSEFVVAYNLGFEAGKAITEKDVIAERKNWFQELQKNEEARAEIRALKSKIKRLKSKLAKEQIANAGV